MQIKFIGFMALVLFSANCMAIQIITKAHDHLWQIAKVNRPAESVTIPQMMLAIYNKNPHAFLHMDKNTIIPSKTLYIPNIDEIKKNSAYEANRWLQNRLSNSTEVIKLDLDHKLDIPKQTMDVESNDSVIEPIAEHDVQHDSVGTSEQEPIAIINVKKDDMPFSSDMQEEGSSKTVTNFQDDTVKDSKTANIDMAQRIDAVVENSLKNDKIIESLQLQLADIQQQILEKERINKSLMHTLEGGYIAHPIITPLMNAGNTTQLINDRKPLSTANYLMILYALIMALLLAVYIAKTFCGRQKSHDDYMEDDEYDYMGSTEGISAKIDLARAYINMNDLDQATQTLKDVIAHGDATQQKEASQIMDDMSKK